MDGLAPEPEWIPPPPETPATPSSRWQAWGRHAVLFALTAVTIFLTGSGLDVAPGPDGSLRLALDVGSGLRMATAILSILLAHEMGHYVACRLYGVDATLPFFIPAPPPLNHLAGTFGAVIRIRSPFPHRRALFDIGIAGPLAGFAVCLPVLVLGILESRLVPTPPAAAGQRGLGEPLFFQWAYALLRGHVPDGMTVAIGPLGMAAWFGLLVTALNLIPVGQLDGGHVTYALLGGKSAWISRTAWWLCVLMVVLVGPSWILWTILVRLLGIRHPPTLDDARTVGRGRALVGVVGLLVFVGSFLPNPFLVSWADLIELVRASVT